MHVAFNTMSSHRVLIVDDQPDAAHVMCSALELLGHACARATTGTEALTIAPEFRPDIAIVDIGLPDISGYELARALRAESRDEPLYLAALTGWGTASDRTRALEAGFDEHVTKPADLRTLREILERAERAREAS